mmetsp:Transcript_2339/g.3520  ORF Transcript_2339/g.3520 Transcript_2339/m.3520 type:complete len:159 (-) Transcript_2339:567-1043(-)
MMLGHKDATSGVTYSCSAKCKSARGQVYWITKEDFQKSMMTKPQIQQVVKLLILLNEANILAATSHGPQEKKSVFKHVHGFSSLVQEKQVVEVYRPHMEAPLRPSSELMQVSQEFTLVPEGCRISNRNLEIVGRRRKPKFFKTRHKSQGNIPKSEQPT